MHGSSNIKCLFPINIKMFRDLKQNIEFQLRMNEQEQELDH